MEDLFNAYSALASFPGSPKVRAEEKKRRAWYQPCTHVHVLPRFWVNRTLSVHPPSPKRDVIIVQNQQLNNSVLLTLFGKSI